MTTLLALCAENSPVTGEFPLQRPMTRSFGIFFDLRLNKRLISKQSWGWWFESPSRSLWRHCNGLTRPCQSRIICGKRGQYCGGWCADSLHYIFFLNLCLIKVLANCTCNIFSHWPRHCSYIDREWVQVISYPSSDYGAELFFCGA